MFKQRRKVGRRPLLEGLETRLVLSTFKVNTTTLDTVALSLKTGKDASGHISLRSALEAANARSNADTILLPAGTIMLSIAGAGENNAAKGDLDIHGNVTIKGKGQGVTFIDGNNLDRVFDIFSGKVAITGVTIEHGRAPIAGGALLNEGGTVTLTSVGIQDNVAFGADGGNGASGVGGGSSGNDGGSGVPGLDAEGGAIMNGIGSLTLKNCFIALNQAKGGIGGNGGSGALGSGGSAIAGTNGRSGSGGDGGAGGNGGNALGGGIYNEAGASLTLTNTLFFSNSATGGNGGAGGGGNIGAGGGGGDDQGQGVGAGGVGVGGAGGLGGNGGVGDGGGLYNLGRVTLSGVASGFNSNQAIGGTGGHGGTGDNGVGGAGGAGILNDSGGPGGDGDGGAGGRGGAGGFGNGGGIFNGSGASITGPSILLFQNSATGNLGGAGGDGGFATGGAGGNAGSVEGAHGGTGGAGSGGNGGVGGNGGAGFGGGVFNSAGGTFKLQANKKAGNQALSAFGSNQVGGAVGGAGGRSGSGFGGNGGNGDVEVANGGTGGVAKGDRSGAGGAGGDALGGGLYDAGVASLTGVTVNFMQNQVRGGNGGSGGTARDAEGGNGGDGAHGGTGGETDGGFGGNGGVSGIGEGGGIFVDLAGMLTINPRTGAKRGSKQAKATDSITGNQAVSASPGSAGHFGTLETSTGGTPNGLIGLGVLGSNGTVNPFVEGTGGGVATLGNTTIDNTTITGNSASTSNPDTLGTIKT